MKTKPPCRRTAAFSLVEVTLGPGRGCVLPDCVDRDAPDRPKTQQSAFGKRLPTRSFHKSFPILRADVLLPPGQYRQLEKDSGIDFMAIGR